MNRQTLPYDGAEPHGTRSEQLQGFSARLLAGKSVRLGAWAIEKVSRTTSTASRTH